VVSGPQAPVFPYVINHGFLVEDGIISPTSGGTLNNWNPTGLPYAQHIRLGNASTATITGLAGGVNGRIITISAVGTETIILTNDDAGSSAANRFYTPAGYQVVLPGDPSGAGVGASATLIYDGVVSRWRFLSINANVWYIPVTFNGPASFGAGINANGGIGPAAISGVNNDYNPGGGVYVFNLVQALSADATITGLDVSQLTYAGRLIMLRNASSTFSLTLTNEDALSSATNRFSLANSSSVVIAPLAVALLYHDPSQSRWVVLYGSTAANSSGIDDTLALGVLF
jgi:hypothetical protein